MATETIELLPASVDLKVYRGDSLGPLAFIYKTSNVPVDISLGYTLAGQIRAKQDSTDILVSFTCTITDGPAGTFTIELTAAQSAALPARTLYWDLQITNPSGKVRTLVGGKFTVSKDVTRV